MTFPTLPIALLAAVSFAIVPSKAVAAADIVFADFEGTNYGAWTASGDAFGPGPARGTLPGQMAVSGFAGKGLVNSFFKGDGTTGTLRSPQFTINRRFVSFLVGGGGWSNQTCLNLIVDGQVVRTASGPNTEPGGSEKLEPAGWEVSDLVGKTAHLEIVDRARGGWGHINVDQVVFTDTRPKLPVKNASRQLVLERRNLNFPVKHGAAKRRVSLTIADRVVREFEIELADEQPDWWAFLEITPFRGQNATVAVDVLPPKSRGLALIEQADVIKDSANLYREPLRPQFHFSSRRGWNNDPNGLVFFRGEYHLFYQHNPYGWNWGNMHWGHAVSTNLVHWVELPIALYPPRFGDWAFSGSAVVDWANTSGFQSGAEPPLVAAYTSTGRGECIAFSRDRGRTWIQFDGNPVVKHQGRDPRLLWHAPTKRWVMALYTEADNKRWIAFYTSPNLKEWHYESRVEGFFECPDLFELPVDGDGASKKWVLTAASSEYMVGGFDGRTFTPETPMLPGHRGNAFYAAQTFSDMPAADGRCIQIGWGQMPSPGMPFNQMMTFPCELTLRTTPEGPRLSWQPVRELAQLRGSQRGWSRLAVPAGERELSGVKGGTLDIQAEFEPGQAKRAGLIVSGVPVVVDFEAREIRCGDRRAPLARNPGRARLQILVDRTSLEIFANDGLAYLPMRFQPKADAAPLATLAEGGTAVAHSILVIELKSIWPTE